MKARQAQERFSQGLPFSLFRIGRGLVVFPATLFFCLLLPTGLRARFFEVENARVVETRLGGVQPHIEARVKVGADIPTGRCYLRVYFMNSLGQSLTKSPAVPVPRIFTKDYPATPLPMLMRQNVVEKIQVPVPEALLKAHGRQWRAIVVFGDERDATAVLIAPSKNDTSREHPLWYDFPERALCSKDSKPRPMDETRLLEIRCKTRLSDYPYFTLFARLPDGVTKASEARGIFCLSLLANQISDVRLSLLNRDARGEVAEMIRYADEEKLIILCWGSRRLWDPGKNWDELPKREAREIDTRFDAVASAWESGIKRLSQMYGFETENFLLWGFSGSAQYAMRLAMRKPQYFSAVALQIPSSFDLPTSEAASVLWCLVTGEGESGYYRSQRFYRQCRLKGYRFLYKAVPGLGHQMHVGSMTLAKEFLAYAHSLPKKKEQREAQLKKEMDTPMFYGDWLNQNVESSSGALSIPDRLRVALPTERLVYFWEMKPISGMPRPRSFPVAPILKQGAVSKETAEKLPSANIHSQGS